MMGRIENGRISQRKFEDPDNPISNRVEHSSIRCLDCGRKRTDLIIGEIDERSN